MSLPPPSVKTMLFEVFQLMVSGKSAGQMVTAVPPLTAIRLMAFSATAKNAIECPSGENTGFQRARLDSLPGIVRESNSDSERRYRRLLALYARSVPSGEIANTRRPVALICWLSGNVTEKRVTRGTERD